MVIRRVHVVAFAAALIVATCLATFAHDILELSRWAMRMQTLCSAMLIATVWVRARAVLTSVGMFALGANTWSGVVRRPWGSIVEWKFETTRAILIDCMRVRGI